MQEIERSPELARVANGLAMGQWFIVYAPSGSGKTTFLSQLARHLGRDYRTKYLNLRACSRLNKAQVLGALAETLCPGARAETAGELRSLALGTTGRLALLLDDVGALEPDMAEVLLNNFAAWRSESLLNPRLRNLSLVLSASRDLLALGNGIQSCLNTLEELFLPDFSLAEVKAYAGEQSTIIWQLTEGHPWLTRYLYQQTQLGVQLDLVPIRKWLDNSLLNLTKARLNPTVLADYRSGTWQQTTMSRTLRLLGLAKWSGGQLKVRNPLFAQLIDLYLAEQGLNDRRCAQSVGIDQLGEKSGPYRTRTAPEGDQLYLDLERKEIWLKGQPIPLTTVEYRILEHLLLSGGKISSKDALAGAAYPDEPVAYADVESHIKNIRRKLGDNGKNPRFIRCRRGFGYQALEHAWIIK